MYPWIKCPTCNNFIGHLFPLFKAMRAIKNEQEPNANDLLDVFAILGDIKWCCKTRLLTVREFNEFLHGN